MALPKYLSKIIESSDKAVLAKQLLDKKVEFITTGSVSMDWATGGGFTRGTMTVLWGSPGGGKTLLMLKTMSNEQKAFPNKIAIVIDSEYSFDAQRAEAMGVDLSRLVVIQSNTIEGAFSEFGKIAEEMIKAKDVCFIGVDSVRGFSSLSEEKAVLEGDMDKAINAYGGVAKTIGPVLNLLNRVTNEIGCTTILCNHAMANMDSRTSAYYPYILSGGQKLKHLCSTILFIDKVNNKASRLVSEMTDVQGNPITIGNLMRVKVTKSRKTVEGKVAEFYWNLETGEFEQKESELFNLAKALGVLKGVGSWYTYGPEKQGLKKQAKSWVDTLTSDKNMYNKILNECHAATSRVGAEDDFCIDTIDLAEIKDGDGK